MRCHCLVLLLSLWQVPFGSCTTTPPTGGWPVQAPPPTQLASEPTAEPVVPSQSSDLWPFWVSLDIPSPPPLPVRLTSDPQSKPHAGNTWNLRPAAPPSLKDSTSKSAALPPQPVTTISLGKGSTSASGDPDPWLQDTELPTYLTGDFANLSPAERQVPNLMPQLALSLKERDSVSQTSMGQMAALASSAGMPDGSTVAFPRPTGTPKRKAPTLPLAPESEAPAAPDPQAGVQGPNNGLAGGRPTRKGAQMQKGQPQTGGGSRQDVEAKASEPNDGKVAEEKPTQMLRAAAEFPGHVAPSEDWPSLPGDPVSAHVPNCDDDISEACNGESTWTPAPSEDITYSQPHGPTQPPALPTAPYRLLVPLHVDWNNAMATWGVAWQAHIFGVGLLFATAALLSALGLLFLPLLRPPGGCYPALAHLLLLAASSSRAFSLFYDAYGHLDKLPVAHFLLLHQVPFPCLTGAFAAAFLFLSLPSHVRLPGSPCCRPCSLAALLLLHFGVTFGSLLVLQAFPQCTWLLLISQGVFVALIILLSVAYLVFCCYTRADARLIYHSNTLPTRRGRDRAAIMAGFSTLLMLACAGLQLYAMLRALALAPPNAPPTALEPWPWWAFQLSCRLCEAGVCVTLTLAAMPPLRWSPYPCHCWATSICRQGCCGDASGKQAAMPVASEWELRQQEKLAICEGVGSERLPLYALVDPNLSSLEGLDLLYHGGGILSQSVSNTDTPLKVIGGSRGSSYTSWQLDSDSTADLRPPSPINLRRSIDEALFSPALFPHSLFSPAPRRGSTSLTPPTAESSADQALYRTASCQAIEAGPPLIGSSLSGPTPVEAGLIQWTGHRRGSSISGFLSRHSLDGSSVVLCPSREASGHCSDDPNKSDQGMQFHGCYLGLASATQENVGQRAERDLAVQEEFIRVCRQIDALSISSDTIDL